jgi:hypothetical protein
MKRKKKKKMMMMMKIQTTKKKVTEKVMNISLVVRVNENQLHQYPNLDFEKIKNNNKNIYKSEKYKTL